MIDLYYAPTPNGWKIPIMLQELGLPYGVIPVDIRAGGQFRPEFLAISPSNRIPEIVIASHRVRAKRGPMTDSAKQSRLSPRKGSGLRRCARNDGLLG